MKPPTGKRFSIRERLISFRFAFKGIATAIRTQHNFRIHIAILALVITSGFVFGISPTEWCIVLLASALVLGLEMINTALEFVVDMISPEYHEKAGAIKDISAASVLIAALVAATCGIIIFSKYILESFSL
ncbi:MAG: diacylglycerol kinase family protein [Bacteroidales bacterium]